MSPRASVGGAQKQPRIKARPLAWRSAHWSAVCAACCARSRANGFYGCWASHSARFCRPMGRGSVRPGSDPFVRRFIAHPVEIVKRILVRRSWPGTLSMRAAAPLPSGRGRELREQSLPRRVDSRPSKPTPASPSECVLSCQSFPRCCALIPRSGIMVAILSFAPVAT